MPFKKNSEFKYSIRGINRIVEERGNQFIRFAQIAWADQDEDVPPEKIKYDLRKYISMPNGEEKMLKGISFLTPEGPNELSHILLEEGFGDTCKVLSIVQKRKDFSKAIDQLTSNKQSSEDICDLNKLLG